MTSPSFELISFRLCPFVQRAVILLDYKEIEHKLTFIDLSNPPDWFRGVSPQGKVPVLRVGGHTSVFESAVISEYLDEVTQPRLMPPEPLVRAINRSWIEYATAALLPLRDLTTVGTADELHRVMDGFRARLDPLDGVLGDGPFFNGTEPTLVDFAYAPMFARLEYFAKSLADLVPSERFAKIAAWSGALLGLAAVKRSIGDDFSACMDELVAKRQGYLASLLPEHAQKSGPRQEY